jgi:hypothetical protein
LLCPNPPITPTLKKPFSKPFFQPKACPSPPKNAVSKNQFEGFVGELNDSNDLNEYIENIQNLSDKEFEFDKA